MSRGSRQVRVAMLSIFVGMGMAVPKGLLAGSPFDGEKVFTRYCRSCHGSKGGGVLPGAPDFSWRGLGNNGLTLPDPELANRIQSGGRSCPTFGGILSRLEILDVITYLRTLR